MSYTQAFYSSDDLGSL